MAKWSRQRERIHWALVVLLLLGACVLIVLAVVTSKPQPCVCQEDYRVDDVNRDGRVNVLDVQQVVNAFLVEGSDQPWQVLTASQRCARR